MRDGSGKLRHFIGIFADITEHKAAGARIEFLAHHDALTGLPNRLVLRDSFQEALLHARQSQLRVALLFLDLDRFKTINDSLGHPAGDQLLEQTARRLKECVRTTDTVCREGGDEFLIVLANLRGPEEAVEVAQRILQRLSEPFEVDGRGLTTSCSIGISMFPDDGDDFDTLHKKADIAMYQSKKCGRSTYHFFTSLTPSDNLGCFEIETQLRTALERGELAVHFQPIVELESQRIVGAEALLRWHNALLGTVSPSQFIPVAEETGLIVSIGRWVLQQACQQAKAWQVHGHPVAVAVNISSVQIKRVDLVDLVRQVLRDTELPPHLLELELTESSLIENLQSNTDTVRQLVQLGVSLSIDDFGTGYSSLAYLKRFSVQKLKIDRSFVGDILTDKDDAAIVDAIIHLGRILSLHTVAEGVEDAEQAEQLRRSGCQFGQGFFFAKALPAHEFEALLDAQRACPVRRHDGTEARAARLTSAPEAG